MTLSQTTADRGTALSLALREGSRSAHRTAESAGFMQRLMTGRIEARSYLAYVERLRAVYAVLERTVDAHHHHPSLAAVHDERLRRSPALDADVAHWRRACAVSSEPGHTAAEPADTAGLSPAVATYVHRIRAASDRPWLLVAHHYTRYLGDLSGGLLMRRQLLSQLGDEAGLAFFDFPAIADPAAFKRGYRDRLDGLSLDPVRRAAIIAEVGVAFECNRMLLAELDPRP